MCRMIEDPPPFEQWYRRSGGGQHGGEGGEKQQAADGDHRECIAGLANRPKADGAVVVAVAPGSGGGERLPACLD